MTQLDVVLIECRLERAAFSLCFTKYPSRDQVKQALKTIWDKLRPENQDKAWDILLLGENFPEVQLPHNTHHNTMAGCFHVKYGQIWDNR